jgi:high-affinity iron transporter
LIALLAAGMAAQAVGFLEQAAVLPQSSALWDTSEILSEKSLLGRALHTLIGYTDQPSAFQLVAYVTVLAANVVLLRAPHPTRGRPC